MALDAFCRRHRRSQAGAGTLSDWQASRCGSQDRHGHRQCARLRTPARAAPPRRQATNTLLANPEDGERQILLTDFGIARNVNDISGLTATNMTVGTVAYCAPKQSLGEDIDGRADQYSLAATAFHLLTGSQLFPNSNPAVVISRHPNSPRPALVAGNLFAAPNSWGTGPKFIKRGSRVLHTSPQLHSRYCRYCIVTGEHRNRRRSARSSHRRHGCGRPAQRRTKLAGIRPSHSDILPARTSGQANSGVTYSCSPY